MNQYVKVGTHYDFGLQEIGELILRDAFRFAAKSFLDASTPVWEASTINQSVAFIQGSGVETVIRMFSLNLDPDVLRSTFEWKIRHLSSASSCATTSTGLSTGA